MFYMYILCILYKNTHMVCAENERVTSEGDIDLYIKTRWQICRSIHERRVRHLDIMHDARDGDNDDNQ